MAHPWRLTLCFTLISVLLKPGVSSNVTSLGCYNKICYWTVDGQGYHWVDAGRRCTEFRTGSSLATIEDDDTNTFLWTRTHPLGLEPYIGVVSVKISWQWVNGTYYNGMIQDRENSPHVCNSCALLKLKEMDSETDVVGGDCFTELPFICSKTGKPAANWKPDFVSASTETWPRARQRCRQMGMDLAIFPDVSVASVAAFLKTETSFYHLWMGAYSRKWISLSSGREVVYTKAKDGACDDNYKLGLNADWPASDYCCRPSLCALGEDGRPVTPSSSGPPLSPGGTTDSDPTHTGQGGFNVLYQVIIPVLCALVVCVIVNVITCVIWRRITSVQIHKITDELERKFRASKANSRKNDAAYYEELDIQDDPHTYTGIKS